MADSPCFPFSNLAFVSELCDMLAMSTSFESLVDQVRICSLEEKEELKFLLERALIEERRRQIATNHRRSQDEVKRGRLKFSSSLAELKKSLAG